jgi:hypothetical protein
VAGDVEGLAAGRYGLEDKAGDAAFRIGQARDYARALPGSKHKGIIDMFSSKQEAEAAYLALAKDEVTTALVDRANGGIHVSSFDSDGTWMLYKP